MSTVHDLKVNQHWKFNDRVPNKIWLGIDIVITKIIIQSLDTYTIYYKQIEPENYSAPTISTWTAFPEIHTKFWEAADFIDYIEPEKTVEPVHYDSKWDLL